MQIPGFIGRTFFTADCKSAGTPDGCKSAGTPDGCKSAGTPDGCKSAGTPDGRQTPDGSVRNPWSKNALLTQRNPMKKYPGEEWVKSGEEWCATLHLSEPLCLSGFQAIW